ncbi:MAG: hypothetical protein GC166_02510 [Alphaproteobacteria bacterium]|nr:hypothetical protein [Alphaproteobacteria bacterium]
MQLVWNLLYAQITIDRPNPYFDDHERLGIRSIAPREVYLGLFPPDATLTSPAISGAHALPNC